jgi:hypothetical protein
MDNIKYGPRFLRREAKIRLKRSVFNAQSATSIAGNESETGSKIMYNNTELTVGVSWYFHNMPKKVTCNFELLAP